MSRRPWSCLLLSLAAFVSSSGCCTTGNYDAEMQQGLTAYKAKQYSDAYLHFSKAESELNRAHTCDGELGPKRGEAILRQAMSASWSEFEGKRVTIDDEDALLKRALEACPALEAKKPEFAEAQYGIALVCVEKEQIHGPGKAEGYYAYAVRVYPEIAKRPDYPEAYFKVALKKFNSGNKDGARNYFDVAIGLNPELRNRSDYPQEFKKLEGEEAAVLRVLSGATLRLPQDNGIVATIRFDGNGPISYDFYVPGIGKGGNAVSVSFLVRSFRQDGRRIALEAIHQNTPVFLEQHQVQGEINCDKGTFTGDTGTRVLGGARGEPEFEWKKVAGTITR